MLFPGFSCVIIYFVIINCCSFTKGAQLSWVASPGTVWGWFAVNGGELTAAPPTVWPNWLLSAGSMASSYSFWPFFFFFFFFLHRTLVYFSVNLFPLKWIVHLHNRTVGLLFSQPQWKGYPPAKKKKLTFDSFTDWSKTWNDATFSHGFDGDYSNT